MADVPLLDEAAQLLGADDTAEKIRRRAAGGAPGEEKYAREVLDITGLAGQGFVDAATLADWNRDPGQQLTTAERAWADPNWAYGHVIVDEAQELSEMAWRMLMRRCPSRSITIVGDVAQTGSLAGAVLGADARHLRQRPLARELLTVNYRTPAEIMAVAADVLADVAPVERPPESVRERHPPACRPRHRPGRRSGGGRTRREGDGGRLAVIAPAARIADLARAIPVAVPGDRTGCSTRRSPC